MMHDTWRTSYTLHSITTTCEKVLEKRNRMIHDGNIDAKNERQCFHDAFRLYGPTTTCSVKPGTGIVLSRLPVVLVVCLNSGIFDFFGVFTLNVAAFKTRNRACQSYEGNRKLSKPLQNITFSSHLRHLLNKFALP